MKKAGLCVGNGTTKKDMLRGLVTAPKKLETIGIKRLINDALWSQGIRKKISVEQK